MECDEVIKHLNDVIKAQELLIDNQRIKITILELRLKKLEDK